MLKLFLLMQFAFMTAMAELYCPSSNDFVVAYGSSPQLKNQGWVISADGGVATKAAFNMLNGYVEFDVDFSKTNPGVNANVYTISPRNIKSFTQSAYCDGAKTGADWCLEVDWIETNGNCGGATTLHTIEGPGPNGCTAWGCRKDFKYNGNSKYHIRVDYAADGSYKVSRDGVAISFSDMSPKPSNSDKSIVANAYKKDGAVIYSSQWVGWVPLGAECGENGDLLSSTSAISNLVIKGSVVQGPKPTLCKSPSPAPNPSPAPAPAPAPSGDGWLCQKCIKI